VRRADPGPADSAGVPWAGRELKPSPFSGDAGHADPELARVLAEWRAGQVPLSKFVSALAGKRVVVPVMAEVENLVMNEATNLVADKDASSAIVCVSAPDGRIALPIFTSVAALTRWNKQARPIPVEVERAALGAVSEQWPLLVVDPGDDRPAIIPRPAVWALAQGKADSWTPAPQDAELTENMRAQIMRLPAVQDVQIEPGRRAETAVVLRITPGLSREDLSGVLSQVETLLAQNEMVAERVDGLELRVV